MSALRPPLKRTLSGHQGSVECLAISPDGTQVVSGSEDRTLRIWDVSQGRCLATLDGGSSSHRHTQTIQGACYPPLDGSWFVSVGLDSRVNVWDAASRTLFDEALNTEQKQAVTCVAVTHDGDMIVTGGMDQLLRVWNIETNKCERVLKGHSGRINSLSVSGGSAPLLTSASSDFTVKVWPLWLNPAKELQAELAGHTKGVLCAKVSVDGRYVVSASLDGTARLWDLLPCQDEDMCILVFSDHEGPVTGVDLCNARMWMATCGMDGTVRLVDLDTGLCLRTMTGHSGPVNAVAIAWNGDFVVSAGRDATVKIWDLAMGSSVTTTEVGPALQPTVVAVSPDHKLLATAVRGGRAGADGVQQQQHSSGSIILWDLDSGLHDADAAGRSKKMVLYCDPELAMPRSRDASSEAGQQQPQSPGQQAVVVEITRLAFTRDGKYLVAGTSNKRASVWVWKVSDGKMVRIMGNGGQSVDSMDVATLLVAAGSKNGKIRVWTLQDMPRGGDPTEQVSLFSASEQRVCEAVAISGDERLLAAAVQWKVLVWNISKPDAAPRELVGHTEYVNCVSFQVGREVLVSGSRDTTIRVWDLDTGGTGSLPKVTVLEGHTAGIKMVLALPSSAVISAGDDMCVKVWKGGHCTRTMEGLRSSPIVSMASPPDGSIVATVTGDFDLRLWDLEQQPSREEIWGMLEEARADPKDQEFWHLIEANPALVLENSRCGGSGREGIQNLLHFLVWHDEDEFVTRILSLCPHAALAKDLSLQPSDKGKRLDGSRAMSLLRRALLRRSTSVQTALLTRLAALLTEPQGLRNPRRCFESLHMADLCGVMAEIPDLCVSALRPLLNLQSSAPRVSSGCTRRMLTKGEAWTAGAQTLYPTGFWKDRFSTQLPTDHTPPPVVESTILWRLWMMVLRRQERKRHQQHHQRVGWGLAKMRHGSTVHVINGGDETMAAPTAAGGGGGGGGGLRNVASSALQKLSKYSLPDPSDQKMLHDRAGILVRPYFIGLLNAAGPPFSSDDSRGAHSFLQACVDLSIKLGNASIFETDVLVSILSFKWNAYAKFIYLQELFLYLALLLLFSSSCFYLPNMSNAGLRWVWELAILGLSCFFWRREYLQITHQGVHRYLSDSWNYVDMVTYSLCFATFIARAVDNASDTAAILGATALLPAWFKCLFYMRAFSSTGVMIRTIFEVIHDIRWFFAIVLLVIVGFSQFYFIMFNMQGDAPFASSLGATFVEVFLFNLGVYNPDPSAFDDTRSPQLTYFFYVLFVVINGVILLNILIAIMGDSFNRVQSHAVLEWRLEQACIILELESLMSERYFHRPDLFPRWLQVLRAADWSDDLGSSDEWSGAIGALNKRITQLERRLDEKLEQNETRAFRSMHAVGQKVEKVEKVLARRLDAMTKAAEAQEAGMQGLAVELDKLANLSKQLMKELVVARGEGAPRAGGGPAHQLQQHGRPRGGDGEAEGDLSDLMSTLDEQMSFSMRLKRRDGSPAPAALGLGSPPSTPLTSRTGGATGGLSATARGERTFKTANSYAVLGGEGDDDSYDDGTGSFTSGAVTGSVQGTADEDSDKRTTQQQQQPGDPAVSEQPSQLLSHTEEKHVLPGDPLTVSVVKCAAPASEEKAPKGRAKSSSGGKADDHPLPALSASSQDRGGDQARSSPIDAKRELGAFEEQEDAYFQEDSFF